jgi:hypothetical protein
MAVTNKTRKILWVESGGRCAIPTCRKQVLTPATPTDDPSIFGEEAHIVPDALRGPRKHGRKGMTQKEIDSHGNLILLCRTHHKMVDDQEIYYTIELLRQIKHEHAAWIAALGEDDRRPDEQAQKISTWPCIVNRDPANPEDYDPAWGATLRNASELPVYQVWVEFVPIKPVMGTNTVIFEVIPPGDWHISGRMVYHRQEQAERHPRARDLPDWAYVTPLRFTDTNDQTWQRHPGGVLSRLP